MMHSVDKLFPTIFRKLNGTLDNFFPTINFNKAYSGWSDPRDIRLCKDIAKS